MGKGVVREGGTRIEGVGVQEGMCAYSADGKVVFCRMEEVKNIN